MTHQITDKRKNPSPLLLAGDVGGTKTHLGLFDRQRGVLDPVAEAIFISSDYPNLEKMVREFLSPPAWPVEMACIGVAGPVVRGRAKVTNLPWELTESGLAAALGLSSVRLINDLLAMAWSITSLGSEDLITLNPGHPDAEGNMALLAPGTGLGEAFLTWDGRRYQPCPSEGGHADFAPSNPREAELYLYLAGQLGHVSYDRICSGSGLPRIYRFLKEQGQKNENPLVKEALAVGADPTPIIIEAALNDERPCALCREALEIFVRVLGAEAGNLALKVLATGGVYLGGGIPPRLLPLLKQGDFMDSFCNKGRLSYLLSQVPVYVIVRPGVALLGAAACGFSQAVRG